MDQLYIFYEIINIRHCVAQKDNSSCSSYIQTEGKQNHLNIMAKTLYVSSLELYSQISCI